MHTLEYQLALFDGLPGTGTGTVDPASQDTPLRTSIGASLIWDSPFGPLRVDYAIPFKKAPGDQTQEFNFGMSTKF